MALVGRGLFSTYVDPLTVFYKQFGKNKLAWSQKLTREYGKKVVVCGGSSCAHSIMGLRLLQQHGLPTVNMGLMMPDGATMLLTFALGELRPGDTLVIGIEPKLLTAPYEMHSSACILGCALGHPAWPYQPWETPFAPYLGSALRCHTGWRCLLLIPSNYRNAVNNNHSSILDTDASGWQTTTFRLDHYSSIQPYDGKLSEDSKTLLWWVRQWCERNGVRVAYSLPWGFQEADTAAQTRKINCAILKEIAAILPVFKDTRVGVCTDSSQFTDTAYHLDAETAAVRTDELARQIKNWEVWGPGELEAWEQAHLGSEQRR